jgi:predicted AAA+ superfamily ATPase
MRTEILTICGTQAYNTVDSIVRKKEDTKVDYIPRLADALLSERLEYAGAVLIEGPKYCGKTETALQLAKSLVRFDVDPSVSDKMSIDPFLLLRGDTPLLLDEWQTQPEIWNYVRRAVDERKTKGQFILTGSANPADDAKLHSGVGRISRMRMRPMSWFETGFSSGEVSLRALLSDSDLSSGEIKADVSAVAEQIARGGWPENVGVSVKNALRMQNDYVDLLAEVDLSRVSNQKKNPAKVRALLQSLARNIATEATIETLTKDAARDSVSFNRDTAASYLSALGRLMILEDLPAFSVSLRSSATLRKTPKRHFTDPSIAVGALGKDVDALVRDLNYLGFLFESEVIRDLRVYADKLDAHVYCYRDSSGREADAVVQERNGNWALFEIKLGYGARDAAADSLKKVADVIDTASSKPPVSLNVITGSGFAHKRPDGVNVIPLQTLGP